MKGLLQRCDLTPDTGSLKNTAGQYDFIQNVRGYGNLISKRQGIRNISSVPLGVMGIFDLYRDGDPTSPDKVGIIDGVDTLWIYDWSELTTAGGTDGGGGSAGSGGFQYIIADGGEFLQQSPGGTWFKIYPVTSGPRLEVEEVAAPTSTRATDLVIHQNELFGSIDGTTTWRFFVDNSHPPNACALQQYGPMLADTTYSTLAFTSAAGLVFELNTLLRYRIGVADDAALTITEV